MFRRIMRVGIFVVGPYQRGTIMQLAIATVFCIIFLVIQLQAMPYRHLADNYLGLCCSLSLTVFFLCCNYYKFATLTELKDFQVPKVMTATPSCTHPI